MLIWCSGNYTAHGSEGRIRNGNHGDGYRLWWVCHTRESAKGMVT